MKKLKYTTEDFDILDWHDVKIHQISFVEEDNSCIFEIDYYECGDDINNKQYYVTPCKLNFFYISDLKININWDKCAITLSILHITRTNQRKSPNGKFTRWDWEIKVGWPNPENSITFESIGFEMTAYCKSILFDSYSLPYKMREKIVTEYNYKQLKNQ